MYTNLYIKTNYSLLSSLVNIDKLIDLAKKKNLKSLAVCDDDMTSTLIFYKLCKKNNIKPIIGLDLVYKTSHILLYAKDYDGYKSLIKLSTIKSAREIEINDLKEYNNGLIGIIPFDYINLTTELKDIYNDLYISYSNKTEEAKLSKKYKNIVFINKVLYLEKEESKYLKYLYMIRDNKTVLDEVDFTDNYNYLLDEEIYSLSSNMGLNNTNVISDMCNLEFPKSELLLPIYETKNNTTSSEYLKDLSITGLNKRLQGIIPDDYKKRLIYELSVIDNMGFSNYFLVVYDFIKYAKKNNILVGPGRGSAGGSLVAYSLGITDIDPIKYDLLFERFLNPERITMPDIDTDFPDKYRDQVIDYVVSKYGQKKVSGIVTFGTLASKQALRDVARVLDIPNYQIDLLSKKIPGFTKLKIPDFYKNDLEFREIIDRDEKLSLLYKIAKKIEDYPRHTSSHAAGIVMSKVDLDEVIPLTMSDGMYLTGYTMEYLEELGLLKMDFLGLKTLTTIMNIIESVKINTGKEINFNEIPLDDKKVLEIFSKANTLGIFQFESEGMKNFLRKLKPSSFEDIFAAIALFRPGPASNIDTYIRRKHGLEKINYIDPSLEPILKNTYGIIIYQEQIMQIARTLAGYSLGEADILRRAMSKKKKEILIEEENKFIKRSIENGYKEEVAKEVYDLILKFAGYGFNRSHSVAYSMVAYKMAYLKYYYPKEFYNSLLSSVIGSTIKENMYIREAKANSINVFKPSINNSNIDYTVTKDGIYFPLTAINGIGMVNAKEIISNRKEGYTDIFDFLVKNPNLNKKVLENLIKSGCFDEFNITRKTLIDNIDELLNYQELVKDLDKEYVLVPEINDEKEYSKLELISMEKEMLGIYLSKHPVMNYKANYNDIVSLDNITNYFNKNINIVLLVEKVKVIKTKKNEDMMFITASDEYKEIDLTLFPKTYIKYPNIKVGDIIKVNGKVERRYDSYQIIVEKLEKLN